MYDTLESAGTLGQVARVIDEFVGGARASSAEARESAFVRAAALFDDPEAGGGAARVALVEFARDLLVDLAVQPGAAPADLGALLHNLQDVAGISPVELGRELLRAPQLLELPRTRMVEVELALLLTLTNARAVSLWRRSAGDELERIAADGSLDDTSPTMQQLARRLLDGKLAGDGVGDTHAGVVVHRSDGPAALVAYGHTSVPGEAGLLLESAVPILTTALEREDRASAAERRLARVRFDMHDGPQQDVLLLAEDLRLFRSQLESVLARHETRDRLLGRVDDLEARLIAVDGDLRRISVSAQSPFHNDEPLQDALAKLTNAFAERSGIEPAVELHGVFTGLTDSQHITLLGLIREALSNIREHSDATRVSIRISAGPNGVEATVTDDGRGFHPEATAVTAAREGHLGLVGMHERARMLGGQTEITSRPGGPTVISVKLPRPPEGVPTRA